jgi:hypothetical protein
MYEDVTQFLALMEEGRKEIKGIKAEDRKELIHVEFQRASPQVCKSFCLETYRAVPSAPVCVSGTGIAASVDFKHKIEHRNVGVSPGHNSFVQRTFLFLSRKVEIKFPLSVELLNC